MSNIVEQAKKTRVLFVPAELIEAINQLSERTLLRCKRALKLWLTGRYDYIVVTGGRFLPPAIQTIPAGQLMAEWFVKKGVEPDKVITEIYSLDTYENISGSITTMAEGWGLHDFKNFEITVVTQWQHAHRFALSFKAMYGLTVKMEPVDYPLSFIETLKEYLFILIHWLDPRGKGFLATYNRDQRRLVAAGP